METRKNTLKLIFAQSAKVPVHLDVLRFIMRVLKIPATDVHSVYKDENDQRFYLKFIDEGSFNRFSSNMDDLYWFQYADGDKTRVQLELASRQFKYVRIFNVPPETEDKDIAAVLGQFGRIRQHVRERYPAEYGYHVFSGVRGIHIEVEKEIPASLFIRHFRARLYYEGLKNKCFYCKVEGHNKAECPKLAEFRDQGASGPASNRMYSQVAANLRIAAGPSSSTNASSTSMTVFRVPNEVPRHPSAQKANQEVPEKSTTSENVATSGEMVDDTIEIGDAVEVERTSAEQEEQTTGEGQQQTMDTNDTRSVGRDETGLKRPPGSENDSSDAEKANKKGGGKKKKQSPSKSRSRSRSGSHDKSGSSSRGRSRGRGKRVEQGKSGESSRNTSRCTRSTSGRGDSTQIT